MFKFLCMFKHHFTDKHHCEFLTTEYKQRRSLFCAEEIIYRKREVYRYGCCRCGKRKIIKSNWTWGMSKKGDKCIK
jgi:hypothetical protein